jgi:hypothetical protein
MRSVPKVLFVGCFVVILIGCSKVKQVVGPDLHISEDTLIGRWRDVTKDESDERAATPGMMPLKIYWEFKKDHTFESKGMFGDAPATWKVLDTGHNNLTFDLIVKNFPARGRADFETRDKCTVTMGQGGPEEVFALTRIP